MTAWQHPAPTDYVLLLLLAGYYSLHLRILFMALRMRLSVLPSSYWATSSQKAEYSGREMQKRTL